MFGLSVLDKRSREVAVREQLENMTISYRRELRQVVNALSKYLSKNDTIILGSMKIQEGKLYIGDTYYRLPYVPDAMLPYLTQQLLKLYDSIKQSRK